MVVVVSGHHDCANEEALSEDSDNGNIFSLNDGYSGYSGFGIIILGFG